jgi:VCBS repeat-containing protein
MTTNQEIAFIDPAITDLDVFIAGLRPEVEAIVLHPSSSAPAQIAKALCGRSALQAVHIVAHGKAGEVSFSAGALSMETLNQHADDLVAIGHALGATGSLNLWTCETAQGEQGQAFVAALAGITGVGVAASARLVGATGQRGGWVLDTMSHANEKHAPLTVNGMAGYAGVMATVTTTSGNNIYDGTANSSSTTNTSSSGDTINVANNTINLGDSINGGIGNDNIQLNNAGVTADFTVLNASTGLVNVETMTGGTGSDIVTLTTAQFDGFTTINLGSGTDVLNVKASGTANLASATLPTLSNTETVNLIGTSGDETVTLTTTQMGIFDTVDLSGGTDSLTLQMTNATVTLGTMPTISNVESVGVIGSSNSTNQVDTLNLSLSQYAALDSINLAGGTDTVAVTVSGTVDVSAGKTPTLTDVENVTLTGSSGADTVTLSAAQYDSFTAINLAGETGGDDILNVKVSGTVDLSSATLPSVSGVEIGNLTGSGSADSITLTGTQLNTILIGSGTINLGGGTDTINLTSTSTDLNTLGGATDASIVGVEAISASTAASGVIISLTGQSEAFTITGSSSNDTITTGNGSDFITGGGGADTITSQAGGGQSDTFIYTAASDSAAGVSSRDTLVSFDSNSQVEDDIDVSALLGATNLTYLGATATGAAYSLWHTSSGANTTVYADVTGDNVADLEIFLSANNGTGLDINNFIGVTAAPVNTAPVANPDTGAVNEDATLTVSTITGVIQGAGADTDAQSASNLLVVSGAVAGTGAVTQGAGVGTSLTGTYGHLTLNSDGSYSYVADTANGLSGGVQVTDTFTYTVKDPSNAVSNTTTLKITVTGVNDAPVVTSGATATVAENAPAATVIYTATATDADASDTVTWSLTGTDASLLSINAAGEVTLNAPADFESKASYSFNVVASDGTNSTPKAVVLGVTNVNEAPVLTAPASINLVDTAANDTFASTPNLTGTLAVTDPDGPLLTYGITGGTVNSGVSTLVGTYGSLAVNTTTGAYTFTPNAVAINALATGNNPTFDFTVTASDGSFSDSKLLTLNLTGANEAAALTKPTISSIVENANGGINAIEASDGTPVLVSLTGTNAAIGDTLTLNWGGQTVIQTVTNTTSATVNVPTGTISTQGDGTFNVTAKLTNGLGDSPLSTAFPIKVDTSVPTAPAITSISENASGGGITSAEAASFGGTPVVVNLTGTGADEGGIVTINWGGQTFNSPVLNSTNITNNTVQVDIPLATINAQGTGSFNVSAKVTDAAGNVGSNSGNTLVTVIPDAPSVQPAWGVKYGTVGDSFLGTGTAIAGATYYDAPTKPAWINLNPTTHAISYTPTATPINDLGTFSFTVTGYTDNTMTTAVGSYNFVAMVAGFAPGIAGTPSTTQNLYISQVGSDSFTGGTANDTVSYYYATSGVTANLATGTATGMGSDVLTTFENVVGSGFGDNLTGGTGINVLDGGAGVDTMMGGNGNDTYIVDNSADIVNETGFTGTDTVIAINTDYILPSNATPAVATNSNASVDMPDNLTLLGNGNFNLTGNNGFNVLIGNSGNNRIDGGLSNDTMSGGLGDDTYVVNSSGDVVTEATAGAPGGIDTVETTVTLSLAALPNVENLTLMGSTAINGTGNAANNIILGNSANNTLNGGTAGGDMLNGGLGADTLTGGAGAGQDSFFFAPADSGQTTGAIDIITDYAKGIVGTGDVIDFANSLAIGGSSAAATAGEALINQTTGIATFNALSGTTLADALGDIATRFTTAGDTVGEFAFFKVNNAGNYNVFISDGVAGLTANDVVVQLTGVTTINTLDLSSGNLTLLS